MSYQVLRFDDHYKVDYENVSVREAVRVAGEMAMKDGIPRAVYDCRLGQLIYEFDRHGVGGWL